MSLLNIGQVSDTLMGAEHNSGGQTLRFSFGHVEALKCTKQEQSTKTQQPGLVVQGKNLIETIQYNKT